MYVPPSVYKHIEVKKKKKKGVRARVSNLSSVDKTLACSDNRKHTTSAFYVDSDSVLE